MSRRPGTSPLLTYATVAGVTLGWVAVLLLQSDDPALTQLVSNFGLVGSAVAAGAASIHRSRRNTGALRRFWCLLGGAAVSWGGGQALWAFYESILRQEVPFPSPADVGYLGMPVLATAALLSLPLAAPTVAGRLRTTWTD